MADSETSVGMRKPIYLNIFWCFKSEARGSRRNKQPSPVRVRLLSQERRRPTRSFGISFHEKAHGRNEKKPLIPTPTSKGGARHPLPTFQELIYTTNKRHTFERKNTLIPCETACRSHSSFFFCFSHHIPLLHCHGQSTVRERLSLAVTVGSPGSGNPATKPHACPGPIYPGQRGSSRPPSPVPSAPGKGTPFRLTNLAR